MSFVKERIEFLFRGVTRPLRGRTIRRYRRARLAVLRAMVVVFALPQRCLNWCNSQSSIAQKKINDSKVRPFFITDNPNKVPMPQDRALRYETTRLALKQLGGLYSLSMHNEVVEPTRQQIFDAMKRAEMVRGDGKVPVRASAKPALVTKAKTEVETKFEENVRAIEEHSAKVSKALVDGIIGGIGQATRDLNLNDEETDDDDVGSVGQTPRNDS